MPRDYDPQGLEILDEAVACTTSVIINATTYYKGRLAELPERSLLGISDPDYGAWTAVSKGGTRFLNIQFSAVPTDSNPGTGSPPDLAVDTLTGEVYSTVSQTVYFRYVGHGSTILAADLGAGAASSFVIPIHIPAVLPDGSAVDHVVMRWHSDLRITKALIVAPITGGYPPNASMTLRLRNYASADTPDQSRDMAMSAGNDHSGWLTLSSPITITTTQDLVINGDGQDAENLTIYLLHEDA